MGATRQKVILTEKEINDYANGIVTFVKLAKIHKCTKDTIARRMKETGRADVIERAKLNQKRGAAKLSERQIQDIIDRVKAGEYARDLAIEYNMDAASIRYHLKSQGIKAKRAERREWVEQKSENLKIDSDFSNIVPKNIFTHAHKLMIMAMQL